MKIMVTGTSRGLGQAIGLHLHKIGHEVLGCARTDAPLPFRHIAGVDYKDPTTFALLRDELGSCDALVNNVGIAHDGILATQGEMSISDVIQVNLTSTLILTKHYVRRRLRNGGRIVNVSSIIGIRGYSGLVAYSASKAGLDGATRALARELGPKRFRVNSILPGYVDTEMSSELTESQRAQIVRRTPLGRLASAHDIAPCVEFLLSDASAFVTGQTLVVDGGITV